MRLSNEQVQALVREYQDGTNGQELAERYGVARSTVIGLLRSHGATVRRPRISDDEQAQIVGLYREGVRQIDIAERLGRTKGAIWHALRRAGEL